MAHVAVVDLGTGNLHSVAKAIEHVAPGRKVLVTREPRALHEAGHVVLPGQGAIGTWFRTLGDRRLRDAVTASLADRPVLGICLGLQALCEHSDEDGGVDGFGYFSARVSRFPEQRDSDGRRLKVPHMGWNNVRQCNDHPLWEGIATDSRFYFVHSYFVHAGPDNDIAGATDYGLRFTSAAARDNVFAVQFHPEKSQRQGLRLLRNFVRWRGDW
jgi:glutamine amidotransferase